VTREGVRVEGARDLRRQLRAAGHDLGDLKAAHRAAADIVAADAARRAPKRTGRLAGNIRGSGTQTAAIVRVGGARVPYANPIHWGWPRRGIAANRFVTDAMAATEGRWTAAYQNAVDDIVRTVRGGTS
jgi:hypothetical protein